MQDYFERLLISSDFPARWHCGRWSDFHGWLHIVSDLVIFSAYMAIPFTLAFFVIKKSDLPFPKIFILFSAFIISCGITHLFEVIIFWHPHYRLAAIAKFVTAAVSMATVVALFPVIPKALAMKSPKDLALEVERQTTELSRSKEVLREVNERLHAKNQEVESFVYTVSHDLKSPLVTLSGFVSLLEKDLASGQTNKVADSLERVKRASKKMSQLIDEILHLSRVGRVPCNPQSFDSTQAIDEILDGLCGMVQAKNAQIKVQPDLPEVYADPVQFRQVIENLTINALKHNSTDRQALVEIGGKEDTTHVCFFVRDNGPGITESKQEKLFGLSVRGDTRSPGSGVGLFTVSKIIENHLGRVWIDSKPTQGATFWVTFAKPTVYARRQRETVPQDIS